MHDQIPLNFTAARALGEVGAERARGKAERLSPGFSEDALAFIASYAAQHPRFTSEQCTVAMRAAGIAPHDDRAFGSIYAKAARLRLIHCIGFAPRVMRGHGAPGARIYEPGTAIGGA